MVVDTAFAAPFGNGAPTATAATAAAAVVGAPPVLGTPVVDSTAMFAKRMEEADAEAASNHGRLFAGGARLSEAPSLTQAKPYHPKYHSSLIKFLKFVLPGRAAYFHKKTLVPPDFLVQVRPHHVC
jgi:hypothetical protein